MTTLPDNPVTRLLAAAGRGETDAQEKLWAAIYEELRRLARAQMRREAGGGTLQTTALVHEAYLRLVGDEGSQWANRRHFFAAAAQAMRRIRIDDARKRGRLKRGGSGKGERPEDPSVPHPQKGWGTPKRVPLEEIPAVSGEDPAELIALDGALTKLERLDARKAELVNLRYFAGLTIDETAAALGVSPRMVDKEWSLARAWLHRELTKGNTTGAT